jgi:hypothetical protein
MLEPVVHEAEGDESDYEEEDDGFYMELVSQLKATAPVQQQQQPTPTTSQQQATSFEADALSSSIAGLSLTAQRTDSLLNTLSQVLPKPSEEAIDKLASLNVHKKTEKKKNLIVFSPRVTRSKTKTTK